MKLLLYCTKAKPILRDYRGKAIYDRFVISPTDRPFTSDDTQPILNGKIVAECDFEVEWCDTSWYCNDFIENKGLEKSCLTKEQLFDYVKGRNEFYAIHIKNLHILDEPRELSKLDQVNNCCFEKVVDKDWEGLPIFACIFTNCCRYQSDGHTCDKHYFPLTHIHNMSKVYDNIDYERKYIIPLSPQEMCRIANGEQTALVRKKVLKEILV